MTGTSGIAAPWPAVACATAATSAGSTSGRAASWTRTTPLPPGSSRSSATKPAWTDSWRRDPPTTTSTTLGGSQAAPATSCQPLARGHDDDPLDLRGRRQRGERPGEQRATVDLSGRACRSRPSALERPAPTTIASARTAGASPLNRAGAGRRSSDRRPSGARGSRTRPGRGRCAWRHPRPRSSCRRRGSRRPARPPCPPG